MLIGAMGVSFVRHTFKLGLSLRRPAFRACVRGLRTTRKMLHVSDGVRFFHFAGILVVLVSMAIMLTTKNALAFKIVSLAGFSIFAAAALWDFFLQINRLAKQAWAKAIGKILSLTFGAAIFYFAVSLAKHQVHFIAQVDPKYFNEFTSIFALFVSPILYLFIGATALGALCFFQLLGLIFFLSASNLSNFPKGFLSEETRHKARLFWYRVRMGKKPMGVLPKPPIFSWEYMPLFMRPVATIAALIMIAALFDFLGTLSAKIDELTKTVLVFVEYQANSRCLGLSKNTRVAYLDRGYVSTAKVQNGQYVFDVVSCKFESEK